MLGARIGGESGQKIMFERRSTAASHALSTTINIGDLVVEELGPSTSAPFEAVRLAHVALGAAVATNRAKPLGLPGERKKDI